MCRAQPRTLLAAAAALAIGCAAPVAVTPKVPDVTMSGSDGRAHRVLEVVGRSRATVITFFSASCPCQRAHDERLRALYARWRGQGVELLVVDSEAVADPKTDAAEASARGYPFPILSDPDGVLADALGAEYATFSVVVEPSGSVVYRGGIDSDMHTLRPDASPWLQRAVDQLLAGATPSPAETKSLGCSLRHR